MKNRITQALFIVPLILFIIFLLKYFSLKYFWHQPMVNIYSLVITAYVLSRFVISFFYKPPPKSKDYEPTVSFVIPVKNDERIIATTIRRCFMSDYPEDKIEVITVNDGSTDNTWDEIQKVKKEFPKLTAINFEENRGKRHAMSTGARLARGEILIYIDSDSLVSRDAVGSLVSGFSDDAVGAVCGHADILNADENFLTRMQEVRYYIAFKIIKAAEHVFSSVTCCSGCLSAYRRKYVAEILDKWLNQKFLGTPATFGDDRSLTNFMLRKYRVLYDSKAIVETMAPSSWKKFFRQQLRWKKSWFRETLLACKFMWRKHPVASVSFYLGFILPLITPLVVFNAFVINPVFHSQTPLYYVLGLTMVNLLYGIYYMVMRPNGRWQYALYFPVVYVTVLSWQTYYAILTCYKNHWGTR